jgi:hypothetical protein
MDDIDIGAILTVLVIAMVPALVVFIILTMLRVRRGKFHRQRISKK